MGLCSKMLMPLEGADAIMLLRIQHERQTQTHFPSLEEYSKMFGLKNGGCKPSKNCLILHPGPINRGVEIDSVIADDHNRSLITTQVEMGVATRMACLEAVSLSALAQEVK